MGASRRAAGRAWVRTVARVAVVRLVVRGVSGVVRDPWEPAERPWGALGSGPLGASRWFGWW
ncbi:hypothetical protein GCM10023107_06720 [Actinoplanes octamycinicus]|nr:hypothetical protein Aoc01nite_08260 [Actinoplanes octamycinicus]